MGVWKPLFVHLIFFVAMLHSEYISFSHNSSSSGTASATGTAAPTVEAAVGVTSWLTTCNTPASPGLAVITPDSP
jgi:hypothetical protein